MGRGNYLQKTVKKKNKTLLAEKPSVPASLLLAWLAVVVCAGWLYFYSGI